MPEHFVLEPAKRSDRTEDAYVSRYLYRNKPIATLSWYRQNHVMGFVLSQARVIEWRSMKEAIEDLTLIALTLRMKGEL